MLCLSRKTGESVRLELPDGRLIFLNINSIEPNRVYLGICADSDIKIMRTELLQRKAVGSEAAVRVPT